MKNLLFVIGIGCVHFAYGQMPSSWTVNSSNYNYTMTVTGKILNNCVAENNAVNTVAAFVNGECRGVANTTIDNSSGDKLAFLTVYSNVSGGETVDFKYYVQDNNSVNASLDSLAFISNKVNGTIANPILIMNNHPPSDLMIDNNSILENAAIGSLVGNLSATEIDGQSVSFTLVGAGNDNSFFAINTNELQVNAVFNATIQDSFNVVVLVQDEQGCDYLDSLWISIDNSADAPTDILLDSLSMLENNAPNYLVGHFSTVDFDLPNDSFSYDLVAGNNDTDNAQFEIIGDELHILTTTIYDIKNVYAIRVRTTDSYGLSFEKEFNVNVIQIDGLDLPLPVGAYISNNMDGKNDYFAIENVIIYKDFALQIFDQFGQVVYDVPSDYMNDFDGTKNGENLPQGTYYYIFSNENKSFKGYLTIVN